MITDTAGDTLGLSAVTSSRADLDPTRVIDSMFSAKRFLDYTLSAILFVVTAPIVLVVMLLVKVTSRGPAIYSQTRLGMGGSEFQIHKIRTMWVDAEKHSGPTWSVPGDDRITPVGRFLRKSHLDELPQLWNVLRGEMSLVGPRPERPVIVSRLEQALPEYRHRVAVRPGVTGLAQVQLPPDTDLESVCLKLKCDLAFIEMSNIWLDIRLILCTALKVVGLQNAKTRELLRIPSLDKIEGTPNFQVLAHHAGTPLPFGMPAKA